MKKYKLSFYLLANCLLSVFFATAQEITKHACSEGKINHFHKNIIIDKASNTDYLLMHQYDNVHLKLDVAVSNLNDYINGSSTYTSKALEPISDYVFELHFNILIDSILINGVQKSFTRDANNHTVHVALSTPIAANTLFTAQVFYNKNTTLTGNSLFNGGLTNITSPTYGKKVTYSMSESYSGYLWFPCKQQLQDKFDSLDIWLTVDSNLKAGSQGLLQQVTNLNNGKHRFEWKTTYPTNYYLVSLSVSDYIEYNTVVSSIYLPRPLLIQNYIYPNALTNSQNVLDQVSNMVIDFSKNLSPYPFNLEKYGHCMAPISGGEEHQTMTTIGYFDYDITSHELSHQWFGNYVTCATWKDIWLNEGFATWSECYNREQHYGINNATSYITDYHNEILANGLEGTVYCLDTTDENRIFDPILSYAKPGMIINTLRYEMSNDSLFYAFIRYYLEQHKFKNASTESFLQSLNVFTGKDYNYFINQWIYKPGYLILNTRWIQSGNQLLLKVVQSNSSAVSQFLYDTKYEINVQRQGKPDTTIIFRINDSIEWFSFNISGTITGIQADPKYWVLDQNYLYKDINLVAISKSESFKLELYPNPVDHILTINSGYNSIENVKIFNVLGILVNAHQYKETFGAQIDVSSYLPGFYFLNIRMKNGEQQTKTFIVK